MRRRSGTRRLLARGVARWAAGAAAAFLCFAGPRAAGAQSVRDLVEEGNRLYREGRFDEAHARYLEALEKDPESPLIRFNDGNALYRSQDFQRALEAYAEAVESVDPELASAAWYNVGNALYRGQRFQEAVEAYKQALRLNPRDEDAKYNLERVLERLQQQEQQQQQGGGEQSPEDPQPGEDPPRGGQQPEGGQPDPGEEGRQPPAGGQPDAPPEGPQEQPQEGAQPEEPSGEGGRQPQPPSGGEEPGEAEGPSGAAGEDGRMSPEEARRILAAIQEDPSEVNRKPPPARGRKPRKVW